MFRKIKPEDREEFLRMGREFYDSAAVLNTIPERYHAQTFDELMRSDVYAECYIFEQNGCIAGYAMLNKTFNHEVGGTVVWLEELYVRPEFQGGGLGSAFLDWLPQNIPAARYRLETEPENERASALYTRKGYKPLGYCQMILDTDE